MKATLTGFGIIFQNRGTWGSGFQWISREDSAVIKAEQRLVDILGSIRNKRQMKEETM